MSKSVNAQRNEHHITTGLLRLAKEEYLGEYYGQIKESQKALKLSKKTRILYGVVQSRIENIDILEFPVLFKFQATERINVSVGPEVAFIRDRNDGNFLLQRASLTSRMYYYITKQWDASIELSVPIIERKFTIQSHPIEVRTGIKF